MHYVPGLQNIQVNMFIYIYTIYLQFIYIYTHHIKSLVVPQTRVASFSMGVEVLWDVAARRWHKQSRAQSVRMCEEQLVPVPWYQNTAAAVCLFLLGEGQFEFITRYRNTNMVPDSHVLRLYSIVRCFKINILYLNELQRTQTTSPQKVVYSKGIPTTNISARLIDSSPVPSGSNLILNCGASQMLQVSYNSGKPHQQSNDIGPLHDLHGIHCYCEIISTGPQNLSPPCNSYHLSDVLASEFLGQAILQKSIVTIPNTQCMAYVPT